MDPNYKPERPADIIVRHDWDAFDVIEEINALLLEAGSDIVFEYDLVEDRDGGSSKGFYMNYRKQH